MQVQKTKLLPRSWWRPESPVYVAALAAAFLIFILAAITIWVTFVKGIPGFDSKYTLQNFIDVFTYPVTPIATKNTILLALGTVVVSICFALPIAWLFHRSDIPLKKFFTTLLFLHTLIPAFIKVIGWIMLMSPDIGIINQFIRLILPIESGPLSPYNLIFMAILQGLTLMPSIFFMIAGAFVAIDPSYEESAEVCGASMFQSFLRIDLPLVLPALVAGAIYVFMTAISMFEIAALLGASQQIHVFSTLMYNFVQQSEWELPNYGAAGVYGFIMLVPMLLGLSYYQKMIKVSHRYATVTGKGYRPKILSLGKWKWAAIIFVLLYFSADLFFPFLAVLWTSLLPYPQIPSLEAFGAMNFAGYAKALGLLGRGGIVGNTVQLMLFSGILAVVVSLSLSWIVLRTRFRGRFILDTVSMLPHAIPSISFAFAILLVGLLLLKFLPFFYGSIAAIIIADAMRRVPFTTRTISGSLIQIHPELEEAVQISGGSRVTAIVRVLIPLITPALFYSFVIAAMQAYREVTIALFLQSPRSLVLSTSIWQLWKTGNIGTATAMSVIMIGVMGIILFSLLKKFPWLLGSRRG